MRRTLGASCMEQTSVAAAGMHNKCVCFTGRLIWRAGAGQPDIPQNPTIDDFVNAYKPLDAAVNRAFEMRINKDNAREVQFQLAVVRIFSQRVLMPHWQKEDDGK